METNHEQPHSAWVIQAGDEVFCDGFSARAIDSSDGWPGVREGDGILVCGSGGEGLAPLAFARVFRRRWHGRDLTIYFDGALNVPEGTTLHSLGITLDDTTRDIVRLEMPVFENALKTVFGIDFASFPAFSGKGDRGKEEQAYIRDLFQTAVVDDLLGPADGPEEEIIGMSVRDRYLVGKLAPMEPADGGRDPMHQQLGGDEEDTEDTPDDLIPRTNPDRVSRDKATASESDEEDAEVEAANNQSLVPSSFGLTFCVSGSVKELDVTANWGRYMRTESAKENPKTGKPFRCWKREQAGGTTRIGLDGRQISPTAIDPHSPEVTIRGSISQPLASGDRLVTLFLVNGQVRPTQNQDAAWVFQPEIVIRAPEGQAVFQRRPVLEADGSDEEREALEMLYRKQVEFAVGHGISVHAVTPDDDTEHAVEVRTVVLPEYEVPITETPGLRESDRPALKQMIADGNLDMIRLAEMDRKDLVAALSILTDDYADWIEEQRLRIGADVQGYNEAATAAMDRCAEMHGRLREGIDVLASNDEALTAFRFANHAMATQRVHSIYSLRKRRGEKLDLADVDIPKNRSWRPFQLAFILLSIPALTDPTHMDRTQPLAAHADLLWFPTGGGKTEAYLGVAAFTMAIRRLMPDLGGLDGSRGLSVIMRYTLRLLTLQQFQRATALICAMEVLRRADQGTWGAEPFSIGLWVGQRVTPNSTEEAHKSIEAYRDGKRHTGTSPAQLTYCPWCGAEIAEGRDIDVRRLQQDVGRTIIYCGDKLGQCVFSRARSKETGLPVVVVDDEIYRRPPSMLIATVDKFAMMAWRGQVRTLFGRADSECPRHGLLWPDADCTGTHNARGSLPRVTAKAITPLRPPDLIIQDEFHLISGPLGTMVGLYETAVDELSTWRIGDKAVRPKIIASTATVRKAEEQVNNVFLRQVAVFPPHGLDVADNFFSVQRPVAENPGRRYMGICSPGSSRPAVLIRVYTALLTAAQALFERFGDAADPYMTVVGYFNSLRELGGMRRLAEDDVQTRSYRVQMGNVARPGLAQRKVRSIDELTSRVSSKDIPKKLDQLEIRFKTHLAKGEFQQALDIILATNMLSVGVDVDRLGVMAVNGQPKNTAEYIQATSRVGRSFPGLVCTVLTWSRPRDLSHYETFEHYHATFYKHVEAQSVTPFAPRALDRGLTGTMVSVLRIMQDDLNPNLGAMALDDITRPDIDSIRETVKARGWKATGKTEVRDAADSMVADRADRWVKEANRGGRQLGYEAVRRQGDVAGLLKKPGISAWDEFTVPMSMREVEPGVNLVMDASPISTGPPPWRMRKRDDDTAGGDS